MLEINWFLSRGSMGFGKPQWLGESRVEPQPSTEWSTGQNVTLRWVRSSKGGCARG